MSERLVTGAVAIPGEPDYDGEVLTREEIKHAADAFIENYRVIDPEHVCALTNECFSVAVPVKSEILEDDIIVKSLDGNEMNLPCGSWILTVDVTNDDEWRRILDGEATGFSLTASPAMDPVKARKLIRELGEGWVARTVSIVANPAVPKAKFFEMNIDNDYGVDSIMEDKSKFERFYEKVESAFKSMSNDSEEVELSSVEDDVVKSSEEAVSSDEEKIIVEEDVVKFEDSEVVEESLKHEDTFITMEELEAAKSDILEAVKSMMVESEEAIKSKDDKVKNLSEKVDDLESRLEEVTKSRSKGLPAHIDTTGEVDVVKTRWVGLGDNRDMYGRVIRQ